MTRNEFKQSLRSTLDLLDEQDLLEDVRSLASVTPSPEFRKCALSRRSTYTELYRLGLWKRHYNFLLHDYSYLQFAHYPKPEQEMSLRYAFYVNPFDRSISKGLHDIIDEFDYETYFQLLEEQAEDPHASVIRYDVSMGGYIELKHPAAHFHVGLHQDSRWPVDKILSPLAFALLCLKLFYSDNWGNVLDEKLENAKRECLILPDANFSPKERRQLYFT